MSYKPAITDSHIIPHICELSKLKDQLFSRGSKVTDHSEEKTLISAERTNIDWTAYRVAQELTSIIEKNHLSNVIIMCEVPTARDFIHSVFSQNAIKSKAFTSLDPLQTWSAEDLRKDISRGFSGLYLQPVVQHFHVYDKRAYGLYEVCEKLKIPVKINFGLVPSPYADMRYANPIELQPVARDFPNVPFIVPALGGGFYRELLMVMTKCNNVFADLSNAKHHLTYDTTGQTLKEQILRIVDLAGTNKIIFGSAPSEHFGDYDSDYLEKMLNVFKDFSEEDQNLIFNRNILSLTESVNHLKANEQPVSRIRLKRF